MVIKYKTNDKSVEKEVTDILINRPMSLMTINKLTHIINIVKNFKLNQILEVGTFAGGSTYLLAKELPTKIIKTIDTNNFNEYFELYDHRDHLKWLQNQYPELYLKPSSIKDIQSIYKNQYPNIKMITGELYNLDISQTDCIILDGDHNQDVLAKDLEFCYNYMKPGIIFVDDCSYSSINQQCHKFCKKNNLNIIYFDFYLDYIKKTASDMCAIITNPIIKLNNKKH